MLRRVPSSDMLSTAAAAAAPATAQLRSSSSQHQLRRLLSLRFRGRLLGLSVPSEMWGAAALAARLSAQLSGGGGGGGGGGSTAPRRGTAAISAASYAAEPPLPGAGEAMPQMSPPSSPPPASPPAGPISVDCPEALAAALDWRPQLGAAEVAACLLVPAAACAGLYAATAPPTLQPLYGVAMALLYALLVAAARSWLLERRYYWELQRSEADLAAADSHFFDQGGVRLHFTRHAPLRRPTDRGGSGGEGGGGAEEVPAMAVHCLHGFGASTYSWSFVAQQLADALRAHVTAHDLPGFGLSQRPRSRRSYSLHFNGEAARSIMDAELAPLPQQQQQQQGEKAESWRSHPIPTSDSCSSLGSGGGGQQQQQQAVKPGRRRRVLVGHSMGGAAAAEGVISQPEGVAALVLVAPAIVALWGGPPEGAKGDPVALGLALVEEVVSAEDEPGELAAPPLEDVEAAGAAGAGAEGEDGAASSSSCRPSGGLRPSSPKASQQRPHHWLRLVRRVVGAVAKAVLLLVLRLVLAACTPLLVLALRSLVRSRRFWERGLAAAWHDGRRITPAYVDAYRCGQLVRGWEGGLLRFLGARFADKHGFWGSIRNAVQGDGHLSQAERLALAVRRHGIPVLLVHGASDALVPLANSRRLATLLEAELVVFDECGHIPHEECPERFVEAVAQFVAQAGV